MKYSSDMINHGPLNSESGASRRRQPIAPTRGGIRRGTAAESLAWVVLIVLGGGIIGLTWYRHASSPMAAAQASGDSHSGSIVNDINADRSAPYIDEDGNPIDVTAPSFQLTDQEGKPFDSRISLEGHYWIVDFVFTNCAGPCPVMTANMRLMQEKFKDVPNIRFVSITCDPMRDTPEVLRKYGAAHHADFSTWSFLTGDYQRIQAVAAGFGLVTMAVPAHQSSADSPADGSNEHRGSAALSQTDPQQEIDNILHSTKFVLVDPEGKVVNWYSGSEMSKLHALMDDARKLTSK